MNKTVFMNVCNDVKELTMYGIEGIIWILEESEKILGDIDVDKLIMDE